MKHIRTGAVCVWLAAGVFGCGEDESAPVAAPPDTVVIHDTVVVTPPDTDEHGEHHRP